MCALAIPAVRAEKRFAASDTSKIFRSKNEPGEIRGDGSRRLNFGLTRTRFVPLI